MYNSSKNYKMSEINFCINLLNNILSRYTSLIFFVIFKLNDSHSRNHFIVLFIYHFITSEKCHKVFSLSYVVFYLQEIRIVASSDRVYCSHYASLKKKNICINWKNVVIISYLYVYITV